MSERPNPLDKLLTRYNDDGGQMRLHLVFVTLAMLFLLGIAVVMN